MHRERIRSGLFLALIYASFISLGLPDSLLGSSWPVMQPDLGVPYTYAGVASMVVAAGTIVASFFSGQLIRSLGTGNLTRVSVAMTAAALLGFSLAPSFGWLLLLAIPLGLGGGAVDAALNHFVATHYKAHHMNWLHCFWGVGAMTGPLIMARFIAASGGWRGGYLAVSLVQGLLLAILLVSIPLWRQMEQAANGLTSGAKTVSGPEGEGAALEGGKSPRARDDAAHPRGRAPGDGDDAVRESERRAREQSGGRITLRAVLRLPGTYPLLIAYLLYTGIELTVGLWGSSFLTKARAFGAVEAAFGISVFYGSLTLGRILSGFLSMKMSEPSLIRSGLLAIVLGAVSMLSFESAIVSTLSFAIVGLGCAPIYPAMLHQTPRRFGAEWAPVLMGMQMAVAYTGATLLPPLFGLVTAGRNMWLLPLVVLIYAGVMLVCTEMANRPVEQELIS